MFKFITNANKIILNSFASVKCRLFMLGMLPVPTSSNCCVQSRPCYRMEYDSVGFDSHTADNNLILR